MEVIGIGIFWGIFVGSFFVFVNVFLFRGPAKQPGWGSVTATVAAGFITIGIFKLSGAQDFMGLDLNDPARIATALLVFVLFDWFVEKVTYGWLARRAK